MCTESRSTFTQFECSGQQVLASLWSELVVLTIATCILSHFPIYKLQIDLREIQPFDELIVWLRIVLSSVWRTLQVVSNWMLLAAREYFLSQCKHTGASLVLTPSPAARAYVRLWPLVRAWHESSCDSRPPNWGRLPLLYDSVVFFM